MAFILNSFSREIRFNDLVQSVQYCDLCPRLCNRTKVLSAANGNINSKVLFIAEAPGRLGADKTGIPLYGDTTGKNFEALLGNIGWKREDIFITNAVLCNPRKENGNNGTPTREEIANCSSYLAMTIELIQPEIVITLGITALNSLGLMSPHHIKLREQVGKELSWANRILFPLYHPGPRARIHRSLPKQRSDFMALAKLIHPNKGLLKQKKVKANITNINPNKPTIFQQVILALIKELGKITYFKLTKLLYFVDLFSLEKLGYTLTGEIYLRQQEGPWPPKIKETVPALRNYEIKQYSVRKILMVEPGPSPRFSVQLDDKALQIISEVIGKFRHSSNAEIKRAVYRTKPMRYILTKEKQGRDMRKIPVIYKDKIAPDIDNQ